MGFNENLKGELEYKGMSVKELAHATGIPKKTLDKYLLSSASMPPADKATAIAQTLEVTVEYLVTGKTTANKKAQKMSFSPEIRSIVDCVEPLPREKRKTIEKIVSETVRLMKQPLKSEAAALTPLQKVFVHLFK